MKLPEIKMDSNSTISALFEYATEGILITDSKGMIFRINPSAEKIFGYTKGELNNKPIEILIPSRFSHTHVKKRDGFIEDPHARPMGKGIALFGKRKDGVEFPVEVSLSPFEAKEGKYVIAFIIDITERRKAEEKIKNHSSELEKQVEDRTLILREAIHELENTKDELKKSLEKEMELNDMKSRFVSMASHEFRTPLATILSSLSLVTKYIEQGNEEKKNKHINRIKSSVNNMTDILNDFLSLSKLEEGKVDASFEPFDLNAFTEEVCQEMEIMVKTGQQVVYVHSGNEKIVDLDKKLIRNIFFNLISNAIKFSDEGKKILVETSINKGEVIISVTDQGIGIPKEDQEHLFERFYRAHNATNIQGTGLGLNIVTKCVELMKGKINYQSKEGVGTKFTIKFKTDEQ